ncbi:TPA: HPr family phosphocarrier protein [Burkholderia multivorans]|uniref:HPr family phosphocarrier protein n=1 Tax=Burkholderia multivorans TaxID=87883 RepID=UPI000300B128|nr:HPr family phosphocarrier protein [Burkholderia multivorans]MDN7610606.1 HPr family phosphocarrier protein [Burkholderia multivorans]PRH22501.1 HPr family phosphocarrier protein [Burkholderia multivorans]HEM7842301.1 HPr family phosphocarrier protein [Burkholderia multivorans]HEM7872079.1 HPr family phosphocarrier protein [Burkholderia multivorans]HEM7907732.1 HPr family phosphocarrier protein [Burkholderia multivorans]
MVQEQIYVGGRLGLNGYRSARVAATASRYASEIACTWQGRTANAKDVMSVMTLCAPSGAMVHVRAIGTDANEAVQALINVLSAADPA